MAKHDKRPRITRTSCWSARIAAKKNPGKVKRWCREGQVGRDCCKRLRKKGLI